VKFAIVSKRDQSVATSYESSRPEQGTNRFGGPWDDSSQFEHVLIPANLASEPLSNLEPYDGEVQCGCEMVQSGTELAFDDDGEPILDEDGEQKVLPKFVEQPIIESKRLMRLKS
jgi:hypothetical protein